MGELAERAKQKSPYIRLAIGENSEPMVYKGWREVAGQFGESFRYTFEIETPTGLIQKSFDCPQQKFAEQMDSIEFGSKVIIHRKQKIDISGGAIEGKSIYEAKLIE